MLRITQEDIQRVGDEETLLHFLEEKLNLPIPEGLPLDGITAKFPNFTFEQEIDALVYDLYELTTAEIALIEEETYP